MIIKAFRLLLASLVLLGPAVQAGAPLDPARIGWTTVELGAAKFLMSASATISLEARPLAEVVPQLRRPPQGVPVAPPERLMQMRYDANLAGQRTDMTLLLDPLTAAAIQFQLRDSGRRHRQRTWRYTDIGAYHWTLKPAGDREKALEPSRWTERSSGMRLYPQGSGRGAVTDATALVYAMAAAPLAKAGDSWGVRVFSRRRMHEVRAEWAGTTLVSADFRQVGRDGETRRKGRLPAQRIVLTGTTVADGEDDEERFSLLGLTDGIELAVDPATRAPLQLSGTTPYLGRVTFRLRSVTLR